MLSLTIVNPKAFRMPQKNLLRISVIYPFVGHQFSINHQTFLRQHPTLKICSRVKLIPLLLINYAQHRLTFQEAFEILAEKPNRPI